MQDTFVFATKNYPCDGLGRYFASASDYAKSVDMVKPGMADVSAVFCGRFFETHTQAGMWIQLHPDIFDFQTEVKEPFTRRNSAPLGHADSLPAVGAVLFSGDQLHRTVLYSVKDFAEHCDVLAPNCINTDHVFFFVLTRTCQLACDWTSTVDMNDYINVRDEMGPVRTWRRDQAVLDAAKE